MPVTSADIELKDNPDVIIKRAPDVQVPSNLTAVSADDILPERLQKKKPASINAAEVDAIVSAATKEPVPEGDTIEIDDEGTLVSKNPAEA
jgi:hypothetical protein